MYGFCEVIVLAQPPFEAVEPVEILAGSACQVVASIYDSTQAPFVPAELTYSIADAATGTIILPRSTVSTPAGINEVILTATQNAILSTTRPIETHIVEFQITDFDGNVYLAEALFTLKKP